MKMIAVVFTYLLATKLYLVNYSDGLGQPNPEIWPNKYLAALYFNSQMKVTTIGKKTTLYYKKNSFVDN